MMRRSFCFLTGLILLCILANIAAVWIDTPRMRENAAQGTAMLCEQGARPELAGGFKTAQLDNFTSVLILKTAAYTGGESWLMRAFGGFRTELPAGEGQSAWESFCQYADGRESPTGGLSYSRYWHGYLLPLRLLLCFFNVANIQMLLYAAQMLLCGLLLLLLRERGLLPLAPGLFVSFFLMMPAATGLCLQYVPVTLLTLAACSLLLVQQRPWLPMPVFFAAVGILTSYLDLLTFPVVSLAFPLVLQIALQARRKKRLLPLCLDALLCAFGWGAGFAGMWVLKWVLNACVFGGDYVAGVLGQISLRVSTSSHGASFSRLTALRRNLRALLGKSSYLVVLLSAGFLTLLYALRRSRPDIRRLAYLIPLAIPLAWMLLTANHIHDHTYYTCRDLSGVFFAAFALLCGFPGEDDVTSKKDPR